MFALEVGVLSMISRSTIGQCLKRADLGRLPSSFVLPILAATACSSTTGPTDPTDIGSLIEYYEVPA